MTKFILERFADCHITLVDLPSGMLQAAPTNLVGFDGRFEIRAGDLFESSTEFAPETFDCVVSVFTICHAHGAEIYEQLYRRILKWLKPSGLFICFDHVLGDSALFTESNVAIWRSYLQMHMPQEQVEDCIISTYQEDAPLSLRQHLELLTDAGFSSTDVIYKQGIFGMYASVKS